MPNVILLCTIVIVLVLLLYFLESSWKTPPEACFHEPEAMKLYESKEYLIPPLKERTSTKMAMGLKRLDQSNWLTIDADYIPEHIIRLELVTKDRSKVIECLPPSILACHEVLDLAVSFLTSRYPQKFTTSRTPAGPTIFNRLTGETFPIGNHPQCQNPLQTAALLGMEDLNILMKDPTSGEYLLQASATLFPAGWKLQERIGTSLACLHAPVPGWSAKLGAHVNRYFDHLSPKTAMERTNLFIQTNPALFWDAPEGETCESPLEVKIEELTVRRERQTFTRLPKSNAVLFTVRTYMIPLVSLDDEQLRALRSQVWGWEEEIRAYKGWRLWGEMFEKWCDAKLGTRNPLDRARPDSGCPL